MLPKHSRLTKQSIQAYFGKAKRARTARFLVLYTPLPESKGPQLSVTVSKKTAPKAVLRNKLRRRTYSAAAPLMKLLPKKAGILVSCLLPDVKTPKEAITAELDGIFKKAGLY
jgi:ribonuclease P protein component